MFATHYHELTDTSDYLPRVRNYQVAVRERGGKVHYLHRVEPGRAEKSFGIYVAQIAGLPRPVLRRANELLDERSNSASQSKRDDSSPSDTLTAAHRALLDQLAALDINELSPVEALTKLYEIQRDAKELL